MDSNNRAILKTLLYSDIFDFPLTKDELFFFLHGVKLQRETFDRALVSLPQVVTKKQFLVLSGREQTIALREKREVISKEKIRLARGVSMLLAKIPSVYLIGISGGVSMLNAETKDDIDLFIIVAKKTLWTTRFFILLFLQLIGRRRKRLGESANNRICVNMFIDETQLVFEEHRRDIYTAHEIVQLLPLFERDATYKQFLSANSWVAAYLPNAKLPITRFRKSQVSFLTKIGIFLFAMLEPWMRTVQHWYLRRHQTTEEVSKSIAAFHPFDYRETVLNAYRRKCRTFGV